MSQKQIVFLIIAVLFIAAVIVVPVILTRKAGSRPGVQSGAPAPIGYKPDVPQNATLTPPKNIAPASANPALDTKMRFLDLKAAKTGFTPATLTVNSGDTVQLDFTAVDADYDLDFPYLGAYFNVVKKGETRRLPFDTSLAGTFDFQCRNYCPGGKMIKGQLIVLP